MWQPLQHKLDRNSMLHIHKAHSKNCNNETDYQPVAWEVFKKVLRRKQKDSENSSLFELEKSIREVAEE